MSGSPSDRYTSPAPRTRGERFMKPSQWYGAALVMPVIGVFVAMMEASGVAERRLRNPVPAMGEFLKAECVTHTRRGWVQREAMHITYEFVAIGYVKPAQGSLPVQPSPKFTTLGSIAHSTRAECEAALPAALAAKAPKQVWFERDYPYEGTPRLTSRTAGDYCWSDCSAFRFSSSAGCCAATSEARRR